MPCCRSDQPIAKTTKERTARADCYILKQLCLCACVCVCVYLRQGDWEYAYAYIVAGREGQLKEAKKLLSQSYKLNCFPPLYLMCIWLSLYTRHVCIFQHSPAPALPLPANVPSLPLLPLIHLFRAADCLLSESDLPTGKR